MILQLKCGPIASVSFSTDASFYRPSSVQALRALELPKGGNTLDVPDFVVCTASATVLRVCMRVGEEQQAVLLQGQFGAGEGAGGNAVFLDAHPQQSVLAMAGRGGLLQIVDVDKCQVISTKKLSAKSPSCVSFSPDGTILAVGFHGGELFLLDSLSLLPLADSTSFRYFRCECGDILNMQCIAVVNLPLCLRKCVQ